MTLNEYQMKAARTINHNLNCHKIEMHAISGLVSEVGEIHGLYQKQYQGHGFDPERAKSELGDVMWFVAEYASAMGWTLEEVAQHNIDKLLARYPVEEGFTANRSMHRAEGDL